MLSNFAWVRLKQKRYSEASNLLKDAMDLHSNLAPAHCLQAQVLQEEGNKQEAQEFWLNCLTWADSGDEDQDIWLGMAKREYKLTEEK